MSHNNTPKTNTAATQSLSSDQSHRFYFENANVRGEIVTLTDSFTDATKHQEIHPVLQKLLGEFLAAVNVKTSWPQIQPEESD